MSQLHSEANLDYVRSCDKTNKQECKRIARESFLLRGNTQLDSRGPPFSLVVQGLGKTLFYFLEVQMDTRPTLDQWVLFSWALVQCTCHYLARIV